MRPMISTLLIAALPAVPSAAAAVEAKRDTLQPNVPADFAPAASGLAQIPLIVEDLGFAMHPPAGAVSVPQRTGGQFVLSIVHDATPPDPPAWSISVQHLLATTSETTAASQIESHLSALREAKRPHRILENRPITIGGSRGQLCYIEQTTRRGEELVSGWLVLPIGHSHFLVFSLIVAQEEFAVLRPILDASFATLNLRTADEVSERRLTRIDAGRELLASLHPDQLRKLIGLRRWVRIYQQHPSGEGETEIGYSFLEVREGKRGELNPNRPESTFSPIEQQLGLLVRLQGRVIGDLDRSLFFDSQSIYWLAWDQSEEAWDVKGTQRQGQAERTQAETGIRTAPSLGDPRPLLTVIRDSTTTLQQVTNEWTVPDVYLSQALSSVLGQLLPMDANESREFAWYFYNFMQTTPQLTQRIDRWSPAGDRTGNWVLRTQMSIEAPVIQSIYGPNRELVRTIRPGGVISEPTTLEELRRIWQRKGLPMGGVSPRGSGGTGR